MAKFQQTMSLHRQRPFPHPLHPLPVVQPERFLPRGTHLLLLRLPHPLHQPLHPCQPHSTIHWFSLSCRVTQWLHRLLHHLEFQLVRANATTSYKVSTRRRSPRVDWASSNLFEGDDSIESFPFPPFALFLWFVACVFFFSSTLPSLLHYFFSPLIHLSTRPPAPPASRTSQAVHQSHLNTTNLPLQLFAQTFLCTFCAPNLPLPSRYDR